MIILTIALCKPDVPKPSLETHVVGYDSDIEVKLASVLLPYLEDQDVKVDDIKTILQSSLMKGYQYNYTWVEVTSHIDIEGSASDD